LLNTVVKNYDQIRILLIGKTVGSETEVNYFLIQRMV
jgi:hypothetical protein